LSVFAGNGAISADLCGSLRITADHADGHEYFPIFLSRFWSPYCLLPQYMATATAQPPPATDQALVPSPHPTAEEGGLVLTIPLARLPVELDVSVPVRGFRVRNLLTLETGHLIESEWGHGEDVPLAAGRVQLAWTEFEVMDTELAVRLTRLV
jgi:flagellar motor switch protein FliN/FliY